MRRRRGDTIVAMNKRRLEIALLAALIVLATAERPAIVDAAIELRPTMYQVGEFAPQRVETVRDLGIIAVKLLIAWID